MVFDVERYQKVLRKFMVRYGTLVSPNPSPLGWMADDWKEGQAHVRDCGLDVSKSQLVRSSHWTEFVSTFDGSDNYVEGMDFVFTCKCGQMRGRQLRWRGSISDAILQVIDILDEEDESE